MPKKDSLGGQFAEDIKGFEKEYFFLKNLYNEKGWSLSALRYVIKRFVEGWRYDGLDKVHRTPESLDLERKVSILRELGHNRQSKIYFTTQFGERLGEIKFKELQTFQALTNSKEYKGMTDEEFKRYNHSRAITLENMVKKYGEEEGTRVFNEYREKQRYKKSKQRYIDEFGEEQGLEIFKEINKKKVPTLENFQRKYGDKEGLERFKTLCKHHKSFYSKIASEMFEQIETQCKGLKLKFYFAPKTSEFFIRNTREVFFYDCYIKKLKLIIEFNGDVFHANPEMFCESDCPNPYRKDLTSKEIWDFDKKKLDLARTKGYNIIVVWEKDYRQNKNAIVNSVVSQIKEMLEDNYELH